MIHHRTLVHSFGYALEGVRYALYHNQNLRIHFLAAILVLVASLLFSVSVYEFGIIVVMIILVIASEMMNTAIEEMTDLIVKEHRQEAKIAKDVSAGMVLVTSLGAALVGVVIFTPYILELFGF